MFRTEFLKRNRFFCCGRVDRLGERVNPQRRHRARRGVDDRLLPSRPGRHAVRRPEDQRPITLTLVLGSPDCDGREKTSASNRMTRAEDFEASCLTI